MNEEFTQQALTPDLTKADYYILADIDLETGRTVYEQVHLKKDWAGVYAEGKVGFIPPIKETLKGVRRLRRGAVKGLTYYVNE